MSVSGYPRFEMSIIGLALNLQAAVSLRDEVPRLDDARYGMPATALFLSLTKFGSLLKAKEPLRCMCCMMSAGCWWWASSPQISGLRPTT